MSSPTPDTKSPSDRRRFSLRRIVRWTGWITFGAALLSLVGQRVWPFALFVHFWPQMSLVLLAAAPRSDAQVLRELDPIDLNYVVTIRGEDQPAGSYETRFEVVDTPRGRRLKVTATLRYVLGIVEEDAVEFVRTETVFCDEEGIEPGVPMP